MSGRQSTACSPHSTFDPIGFCRLRPHDHLDTRALSETGQHSSLLTFGAIALDAVEQDAADEIVEIVLDRGVIHVDERTGEDSPVPADLS